MTADAIKPAAEESKGKNPPGFPSGSTETHGDALRARVAVLLACVESLEYMLESDRAQVAAMEFQAAADREAMEHALRTVDAYADVRTHWDGCYADPSHWPCYVARVLRARLAARAGGG